MLDGARYTHRRPNTPPALATHTRAWVGVEALLVVFGGGPRHTISMRRTHTRALPWVLLCAYAIAHTHARKKERRGKFIRKEGQGTSRGKGGTYEGHYKSGRRDGYGTMRYTSGDLYAGMWRHGLMDGRGKYTWANGAGSYDGEWLAGKKSGFGNYSYSNGDVYSGAWAEDVPQGHGFMNFAASGSVYSGNWSSGKISGHGILRSYTTGSVGEGDFKDGRLDGRGVTRRASGETRVGFFKEGRSVGEGVQWSADGKTALRIRDGKAVETISLADATAFCQRNGFVVPEAAAAKATEDLGAARVVEKSAAAKAAEAAEAAKAAQLEAAAKAAEAAAAAKVAEEAAAKAAGLEAEQTRRVAHAVSHRVKLELRAARALRRAAHGS